MMGEEMNIPNKGVHRALNDAHQTSQILHKLLSKANEESKKRGELIF